MTNNSKSIFAAIGSFVLVILALVLLFASIKFANEKQLSAEPKRATQSFEQSANIVADNQDNKTKTEYLIVAKKRQSVADALFDFCEQNNIKVKYKDYGGDLGIFVQAIGQVPKDIDKKSDKWWQFWVNGKYSNKGASSYIVNPGDKILWKYTNSSFEGK